MAESKVRQSYRMLFLIASMKLGQKAQYLLAENDIPVQLHVIAQGTASGEIADMLGVGSIEKAVIMTILPKHIADNTLALLRDSLYLGTPNSGVAFTVPMNGSSAGIVQMLAAALGDNAQAEGSSKTQTTGATGMENNNTMIMAFVNQGYSEEVMAAAKPAGAGGGTVFHSRRVGSDETQQLWGITIQEEREVVLILASQENKLAIMQAITEKCGIKSEANGFVISMPVDGVVGINKRTK